MFNYDLLTLQIQNDHESSSPVHQGSSGADDSSWDTDGVCSEGVHQTGTGTERHGNCASRTEH